MAVQMVMVRVLTKTFTVKLMWKSVYRLESVSIRTELLSPASIAFKVLRQIGRVQTYVCRADRQLTVNSVWWTDAVVLVVALNCILWFAQLRFNMCFFDHGWDYMTAVSLGTVVWAVLAVMFARLVIKFVYCFQCCTLYQCVLESFMSIACIKSSCLTHDQISDTSVSQKTFMCFYSCRQQKSSKRSKFRVHCVCIQLLDSPMFLTQTSCQSWKLA